MRRDAVVAVCAALLAGACSGGGSTAKPPAPASIVTPTARAAAPPTIAWSRLRNPLLGDATHAVKDPALVAVGGEWVALFSQLDENGSWRVGIARSRDLTSWSERTTLPHDPAVEGEASPDVVRAPDGTFVVTYQSSKRDRDGGQSKIYARTTNDFRTFSPPIRLLGNLLNAPADRVIDAALAWTPSGLLLGFKWGTTAAGARQHFEIARSTSGTIEGPWSLVGRPDISVYGDTVENYQFLSVGGRHELLATSNQLDRPQLFRLAGDPAEPAGWLHWGPARELSVPQESWNPGSGLTGLKYEHANCAFLVGAGAPLGGFYYLVYADSPDVATFQNQGHAQLAIARSPDLVHWSVPPG